MNYSKNAKRIFAMMLSIVMMLSVMVSLTSFAAPSAPKGYDILVVLDDTASMENTDPSKLSLSAIKKFVDQWPSGDIKLGFATYSYKMLQQLPLGCTTEDIKTLINDASKVTRKNNNTDAAVAVNWGVEQLMTQSNDTRSRAIIIIGDGENDFNGLGAVSDLKSESDSKLADAISNARSNGIDIYAIAVNGQSGSQGFKDYFKNIAVPDSSNFYDLRDFSEIEDVMNQIRSKVLPSATLPLPIDGVEVGVGETKEVELNPEVPTGVYEMIITCNFDTTDIDISFIDGHGKEYNDKSLIVEKNKDYTIFKIKTPENGKWKIKYVNNSDKPLIAGAGDAEFILYHDFQLELTVDPEEVQVKKDAEYMLEIYDKEENLVEDNDVLEALDAKLCVVSVDEEGNEGNAEEFDMDVDGDCLALVHKIEKGGKYKVYASITGENGGVAKSNVLDFEFPVEPAGIPMIVFIIGGIILAIILAVILFKISQNSPDYVRSNVSIKIVGRQMDDEMMIFQPNRFSGEQIFGKKNTLTDLISAYTKWYRAINTGELAETTLNQFINSALTEVSSKITICGNKKKQTIVTIPAEYDMQVDGMDISKAKVIAFNAPERAIDLRFKNQGCTYTINLVFTKN